MSNKKTSEVKTAAGLPADLARYKEQADAKNARIEIEKVNSNPYSELKPTGVSLSDKPY